MKRRIAGGIIALLVLGAIGLFTLGPGIVERGQNKVDGSTEAFAREEELHNLIAEWVDYRIDA